jgi:hypothetical protein
MHVLIAGEFSGALRDAFRRLGHKAWSNDLPGVEPEGEFTQYHLVGDCRVFMRKRRWDLMIAHPDCQYLANSGVRWLYGGKGTTPDPVRWSLMGEAAMFFKEMLDAPIEKIAVENPIMHGYAVDIVGRNWDQKIQPYDFGHGESKATCLWLKNLPPLQPTKKVKGRKPRVHFESPSPDRPKNRSRTYLGIAAAMAAQWGGRVTTKEQPCLTLS